MNTKWLIGLFIALCACCMVAFMACGDDDDDNDDDGNQLGSILGMVRHFVSGDAVENATIKAMISEKGWSETESNEYGVFELTDTPAGSRIYLEFEKSGWCSMSLWVDTGDVDHSGQITDTIIDAIPADSTWTITVRDEMGDPLSGVEVSVSPTTYAAPPVTKETDGMGDVKFSVGIFQSYLAQIMNQEIHGDEYYSASAQTTVDSSSETSTIYMLPVETGDDDDDDDDAWGDDDVWDDDAWDDDAWWD